MVARAGVLASLITLLGSGVANAEVGAPTPTVQAVAAEATWLAYTPPPAHPGIVCMVDSGVDANPDTEAAVIGGQALAPETETNDEIARLDPKAQPGNHPDGHGTLMAMMMAAPINDWGMVGIAPTSVRVYNMKALPKGQTTFPFNYYAAAINECQQKYDTVYPTMMAINLSLGEAVSPDGAELTNLGNFVASAHESNIAVVAAAGNEDSSVIYPAAYPPILAVGAGDAGSGPGALCSFASRGEGLDLIAPGCDSQTGGLQGAFEDDGSSAVGSGSSQASAIVSAVLASMRAYAPQLTYEQTEECLVTTAKNGSIDVAAAFVACGLSQIVSEGKAAEQAATGGAQQSTNTSQTGGSETISLNACAVAVGCQSPSSPPLLSSPGTAATYGFESKSRCPRPQIVGITHANGHLVLSTKERPTGCRLQARLREGHGRKAPWHLTHGLLASKIRLPNKGLAGLQVRYASGTAGRTPSQWVPISLNKTR